MADQLGNELANMAMLSMLAKQVSEALKITNNAARLFYKDGGAEISDMPQLAHALGFSAGALGLVMDRLATLVPVPMQSSEQVPE